MTIDAREENRRRKIPEAERRKPIVKDLLKGLHDELASLQRINSSRKRIDDSGPQRQIDAIQREIAIREKELTEIQTILDCKSVL